MRNRNARMASNDNGARAFPMPGAQPQYGPDKTVDVIHIDLWLRPDFTALRLDAVCTLTLEAIDEDVAWVRLDAIGDSIFLTGK